LVRGLKVIISSDLLTKVLVDPIREGCNALWIVTGYSSPSMISKHREICKTLELPMPEVTLLVGMTAREGMNRIAHEGFLKAVNNQKIPFECRYLTRGKAIHSKVYAWTRDGEPVRGFLGSANYSQHAFLDGQKEVLHEIDPFIAEEYVHSMLSQGTRCNDPHIKDLMTLHDDPFTDQQSFKNILNPIAGEPGMLQVIKLDLFTVRGEKRVPERSGLNWGQREGRNPNQAYIAVPVNIQQSGFFPEPGDHFTIMTDDGEIFNCVRAQAGGKAIETPESNALLGEYFRRRLNLDSGALVTFEDLERYGRSDVSITRYSDSEFKLDFSTSKTK